MSDPFVKSFLFTENYKQVLRTHIPANLNGDGDFDFQLDSFFPDSLMTMLTSDDVCMEKTREPLVDLLFAKYSFKA